MVKHLTQYSAIAIQESKVKINHYHEEGQRYGFIISREHPVKEQEELLVKSHPLFDSELEAYASANGLVKMVRDPSFEFGGISVTTL